MDKKKITIFFILAPLLLAAAALELKGEKRRVWGVLMSDIPENLVVGDDMTRGVFYVFKQTHEPLFRKDDGENFTSRLLLKWERSIDSSEYVFCPDTRLRFDGGHPFSMEYFLGYIRDVTARYYAEGMISARDGCVLVKFDKPQRGYLNFLSTYENAPAVRREAGLEEGLGPFRVASRSKDRIVLDRKAPVPNGYNRIIIYRYKGPKDPNLRNREIADFNFLPEKDKPDWMGEEYVGFNNIVLKVALLVINIRDASVRETVYNCVDIKAFSEAFMPSVENSFPVRTVLPVGFPGGQAGAPAQACRPFRGGRGKTVRLATWKPRDRKQDEFARDFRERSGIRLDIINYEMPELQPLIHKKPHPYEMIAIGISALNSDHNTFLSTFLEEDVYFDFDVGKPRRTYGAMLREDDPVKKREMTVLAAKELEEFRGVLPLYQFNSRIYYPRGIKNIQVGNELAWYPEVADFRW